MSTISFDVVAKDRASAVFSRVGDSTDKTAGKMSKWSVIGAAAAAAVTTAVVSFGKSSVEAYVEAEASQAKLQAAFVKFPGLADTNIDALKGLNTELSKKTKYDDDATASGQAVLASFKLTGQQVTQLTPLLQDYATRTGKDLPTAAQDLGKAMQGQGKALKAIGVEFKDTHTRAGNFDQVMAGLRTQVGGFATNEGKTAAGQAAILKNQFGEVQESVGARLTPALMGLGAALLAVISFTQDHTTTMRTAGVAIGVVTVAVGAFKAATMAQAAMTAIATSGTIAHAVATKAAAIGNGIMTAAQWALNAALTANPIGLVIVAIAALVAGLVIAYKYSETFRNVVNGAFTAVATAATWLWENALRPTFAFIVGAWLTVAGAIVNGAADAFGWMPGIGSKLRAAADHFNEFRDTVNAALRNTTNSVSVRASTPGSDAAYQALRDINAMARAIPPEVKIRAVLTATKAGFNAAGTNNWRGGLTWVGEQGPELVSLPSGTAIHSNSESMAMAGGSAMVSGGSRAVGGSTQIDMHFPNYVGSKQDLIETVRQGLAELQRNGGRLGF